jgi:hypothetical protein
VYGTLYIFIVMCMGNSIYLLSCVWETLYIYCHVYGNKYLEFPMHMKINI